MLDRRSFLPAALAAPLAGRAAEPFRFRYALASSLYGTAAVADILPEVKPAGCEAFDLWPKPHGRQREQLVTGSGGPKGLTGADLKAAVAKSVEELKPTAAAAAAAGVTVAIENHANALIESPDSLRWFAERCPDKGLGVAFAPYHLPQDSGLLAGLIRDLGSKLAVFYAWQHGKGSQTTQSRDDEQQQLPGRGPLDFGPLVAALKAVRFGGYTEVFMHPYPRGRAIDPTPREVTATLNQARAVLDKLV